MESIEKAREAIRKDEYTNANLAEAFGAGDSALMAETVEAVLNAIEAEIAERYMELPLDADRVPIHVGDKMQYHGGEPFTVCAVAPGVIHAWAAVKLGERKTTYDYTPAQCMHYKPRTLEDVLLDLAIECDERYGENRAGMVGKYAAEIRELLGVE